MKIIPLDLSDFSLVEIKTTNDCAPSPHCKKHGAMNKIAINDKGGIWRCITVVGYQFVQEGNAKGKKEIDNVCRAGCEEIKSIP